MRKRIYLSICLASLITLVLTLFFSARVMYRNMYGEVKSEVGNEAEYIAIAAENMDETVLGDYIEETGKRLKNRITFIAADGTVLYDNYTSAKGMENHLDRPEIKDALEKGKGEITRSSSTLGEQTYYYAVRLKSGDILRIAKTTRSVGGLIGSSAVWLVIIAAAVAVVAVITAKLLADSVIKPVNELDLNDPVSNVTYEELSPLLTRMDKQNKEISAQIEKLSEQKRELGYITGNMTEGLVIFGKDGAVLTANASAVKILGNEGAAEYLELCRYPEYISAVESALGGKASDSKLHKDGRVYRMTVNPVEDSEKYGAVLFLVDITETESAEQMRREFSANVSHELKTPLTSIMGAAEIIENGIAKKEDIPHFAGQIHSEASRLLTLIQDIIRISRLDENDVTPEFEQVGLEQVCRTVAAELACKADDRGVTVNIKGGSVTVNGVRSILHEMIYNLCDNAIAYNKKGGSVNMILSEENGEKVLSVEDTGIGIAPEHQARVFERFYRVDKSRSKETGGTGLGLSIVKHGAILHNATVSLESEPGKGTKITVRFKDR
ncbi:MAG: ATP-binding protein [Oscillospiraceae bacterium]|nr:ATP-binding protein [Oscillospiraceae bacterium]